MYYLGISAYYHDSSVALIDDKGEILDFKKEEWHSRVKGDKSFPRLALEEIISNFDLNEKNIKFITFYERPVRAWITILKHSVKNNPIANDLTRNFFKNAFNSSMRFQMDLSKYLNLNKIKILYADHHLSHTLSTYYYYRDTPSLSLVIDGYGDKYCSSIHLIKSNKEIINLWNSEYPNSLGLFYSAITDYLGFEINEGEYKMMGLASYGEPVHFKKLSKTIKFENDKLEIDTDYYDYVRRIDRSYSELIPKLFDLQPRNSNETLILGTDTFKKYADVATSAQKVLEDLLQKIFEYAFKKTSIKKFLLSGGVAMNSVAVKKIGELPFVDTLNVPPSPGDSGAAIGAALYGYLKDDEKIINKSNEIINKNFYPGKLISDESFFDLVLEKISDNTNSLKETSKLIIENEIVATCYGNIETGPRALGHRSLICNAHNENLISKLSTEVKKRNLFRPTAPVILEEFANDYFEINNSIINCYYHMSTVATPKEKFKNSIKGVVHADNTSRVQICNKEQLLGKILTFLKNDKIYLIANTSFNISSDPMVYSKEDAYLAMERMGIKYLLTEKGLYKKK